jgi:hypothetical protein
VSVEHKNVSVQKSEDRGIAGMNGVLPILLLLGDPDNSFSRTCLFVSSQHNLKECLLAYVFIINLHQNLTNVERYYLFVQLEIILFVTNAFIFFLHA